MADDTRVNLKIGRDVHAEHNERREELGMTWTEYLGRCEFVDDTRTNDVDEGSESVDESEIARQVTADLLAQLPRRIADELSG